MTVVQNAEFAQSYMAQARSSGLSRPTRRRRLMARGSRLEVRNYAVGERHARHGGCSCRSRHVSRDYRKLEVFQMADAAAVGVYHATRDMPAEERYGIKNQVRRAAVPGPRA